MDYLLPIVIIAILALIVVLILIIVVYKIFYGLIKLGKSVFGRHIRRKGGTKGRIKRRYYIF